MIEDEKVYSGEYNVVKNLLTVHSGEESVSSALYNMNEETLANRLLSRLIRQGLTHPVEVTIAIVRGLRIFTLTTTSSDGTSSKVFLVAGRYGVLRVCNSEGEARDYIDELLEKYDCPDDGNTY